MKYLILIRHGIAIDREDFTGIDFDRPLTKKGIKEVKNIASFLKKEVVEELSIIISSAAVRTFQTAKIFKKIYHIKKGDFLLSTELYDAGVEIYGKEITNVHGKNIAICGHNNTISECIFYLTTQNISMKKGSVAVIKLPKKYNNWQDLEGKCGLLMYISPTLLGEKFL